MQVKLDENNYYTGSYAEIGSIDDGVDVENLPDELDALKQQAYKLIDGVWEYDANKYAELLAAQESTTAEPSAEEKLATLQTRFEQMAETLDYMLMGGGE